MAGTSTVKYLLDEDRIPTEWYNIAADLTVPLPPPLHPGTGQPIGPDDLAPLFPMSLIAQEASQDRYIEIPDPVRDVYRLWRPTPLYRAARFEAALDLPDDVCIFYKYEGTSPAGSHKPNTAVPQAWYNQQAGVKRITTETGAGQWGSALAMACAMFGIDLKVYMVRISYDQKPYRRALMKTWGAECIASPSSDTNAGRAMLANDPESTGSLGMAISEAVEDAATREDTKYSLGSVLNHVMLHQTVIGTEALEQIGMADAWPDVIVGCVGGGSNFAGLTFPFIREKLAGKQVRIVAAEPSACPTLTRGVYAYDFGDTAGMTPLLKMHTLGHTFMPAGIHAGGLRYHGAGPIVSLLLEQGLVEAVAVNQVAAFESAVQFSRSEGIVPAPESAHAIRAAVTEALDARDRGEARTILFGLSGHGNFDLAAYQRYLAGELVDYEHPQAAIDEALTHLPQIAAD
jgi:tryptophan synthase beta chain